MFVGVPHRLCLWHILQNALRNLGKLSKWKEIEEALHNFGIHDTSWLKETYEIGERWAPTYWSSTFWARMSSTQRSEGINRFFKGYVSIETGLLQFTRQYEAALKGKVEEEKLYELQLNTKITYMQQGHDKCDALKLISESKPASLGGGSVYQAFEKFPKPDKGDLSYSCKLFEFRGILCRHTITIIEFEDFNVIPEKYILSRWRKDIMRGYKEIRVSYYDPKEFDRFKRFRELPHRHCYLSSLALHNDETIL
ncbi:Protein FAR-RED ELONGATED HYPOCOTYL 3, partial [Bienertia sinuspersici]